MDWWYIWSTIWAITSSSIKQPRISPLSITYTLSEREAIELNRFHIHCHQLHKIKTPKDMQFYEDRHTWFLQAWNEKL